MEETFARALCLFLDNKHPMAHYYRDFVYVAKLRYQGALDYRVSKNRWPAQVDLASALTSPPSRLFVPLVIRRDPATKLFAEATWLRRSVTAAILRRWLKLPH